VLCKSVAKIEFCQNRDLTIQKKNLSNFYKTVLHFITTVQKLNFFTIFFNVMIGSIASAQLLMLSGIGPEDHLNSLNIPVINDLPVGNNFHDHTSVVLYYDILNQSKSYESVDLTVQNFYHYYVHDSGPLTMFPNAATYQVTPYNNQSDWPDIMTEMTRSNNLWTNLSVIVSQYGSYLSEWEDYWRPYVG
jgi:hypothetical protein